MAKRKRKKWGKIGAPGSAKRRRFLAGIRKKARKKKKRKKKC